jgi:hypothetical protein
MLSAARHSQTRPDVPIHLSISRLPVSLPVCRAAGDLRPFMTRLYAHRPLPANWAARLDEDREELLAFTAFPHEIWRQV